MQSYMQAISCLPPYLTQVLSQVDDYSKSHCMEICFRIGQPIVLNLTGGCRFVSGLGEQAKRVCESDYHRIPSVRLQRKEMDGLFHRLLDYSIHTHASELHEGYVTLQGGHRAGFCGSYTNTGEKEFDFRLQKIQSIHLRIARQKQHISDALVSCCNEQNRLCSFLIVGPPASGKTTVLRDFARAVSCGECCGGYFKVSVLDERNEICAAVDGIPQFSLGVQTDCFVGYPKVIAARMAVRTMAPKLIVLDELASFEEFQAVSDSFYCGVKTAATVHASSVEELRKSRLGKMLLDSECFDYLVLLDSKCPGQLKELISLQKCTV